LTFTAAPTLLHRDLGPGEADIHRDQHRTVHRPGDRFKITGDVDQRQSDAASDLPDA
jgi:hypothetical protein